MSLQPQPIPSVPEQTEKIARGAFRRGNIYMKMRDELGTFFADDQFVDMYPADGQPAYAPWRLALISVMQFAENLTDRQAADAVRARIDWKYALSLELDDEGFDFSVLSEFRQRLLTHEAGEKLFNHMLEQLAEAGLLEGRGQQRTDSTHVVGAVRQLNRLELVARTLQTALNGVAEVAPDWLQAWVEPIWFTRYGQTLTDYRLPSSKPKRQALALTIGQDGQRLLEAVYCDPDTPSDLRQLPAIEILRQVWVQQYVQVEDELRWRESHELPPAGLQIVSPFDLTARYSRKRTTEWVGYKVHLTETYASDHPHLITHVLTTPATETDVEHTETIHQGLEAQGRLPDVHAVDAGYTSAEQLVTSRDRYQVELLGPVSESHPWQRETGYTVLAFDIDWDNERVVCPQGNQSAHWYTYDDTVRVAFSPADCQACPVREACTRGQKRMLAFPTHEQFEALWERREVQQTQAFRKRYNKRAGVEGTISQGAFALGMRHSRYRGLEKNHLQNLLTAMAMNLTRSLNWIHQVPQHTTDVSRFARLAA